MNTTETNKYPETEQGGVSALEGIKFLEPIIDDLLEVGDEDKAQERFIEKWNAVLDKMTMQDLAVTAHRLDRLDKITGIVLGLVMNSGMKRALTAVDPRLS